MNDLLLTLDLATNLGWSCGKPEDQQFAHGSYRLPKTGEDVGAYLSAYRKWLENALNGVTLTVAESPILPKVTSLATCRKLYGLVGVTEMLCHDRGIRCLEVSNATVKAFLGVRRAPGVDTKLQIVEAVRRYGYEVEDHDQADAIGIRLWTLHRFFPATRQAFSLDLGLLSAAADN